MSVIFFNQNSYYTLFQIIKIFFRPISFLFINIEFTVTLYRSVQIMEKEFLYGNGLNKEVGLSLKFE